MADYEDYNNGTNSVGVEITFSEGTFKVSPHEDSTSGDMVQIYSKTGQLILGITKEGALRMEALTTYADDAAADADTDLTSKCLYKVTGDRTVYQNLIIKTIKMTTIKLNAKSVVPSNDSGLVLAVGHPVQESETELASIFPNTPAFF